MSLVSVVIPTFNRVGHLEDALDSVCRVASAVLREVLVVDNGSTDGSSGVIRDYAHRDPRVRLIEGGHGPRNAGWARNLGMREASGKYIQFLDSDDLLGVGKMEAQVAVLDQLPPDSISTCMWRSFTDLDVPSAPKPQSLLRSYNQGADLLVHMGLCSEFFCLHSWLAPRALLLSAGPWNEALTSNQDGELFGRVLALAGRVSFVPGVEVYYRKGDKTNVSYSMQDDAIASRFRAWESMRNALLSRRTDREAKLAVLRSLRFTAYLYAHNNEMWTEWAAKQEMDFRAIDFAIPIPRASAILIGLFGIGTGLRLRRSRALKMIKGMFPRLERSCPTQSG